MKHVSDNYLYDGSFAGLLTVISYCFKNKIIPNNILTSHNHNSSLFNSDIYFKSIDEEEKWLINKILKEISSYNLYIIFNVYLSCSKEKEMIILYYLLNGFKYGMKISNLRNLNCVLKALKYSNYVRKEAHRLKGFLRFKELTDNVLYAEYESENDILELLIKHFQDRLKNEKLMICDVRRKKIALYNGNKYLIVDDKTFDKDKIIISMSEKDTEKLWQKFFNTIAIKERENKRCQMNFMPKKYWKYMLEKDDNNE